ncbi:MAG: hypothetical protein DI635_11940 [Pseudoxanthomonas suwonensis]|nr:MAG: hypothetical protein DI635_11940 [Pseudoxanthomonas suwonensis]
MRPLATTLLLLALPLAAQGAENGWARLHGGQFRSALKYEDQPQLTIAPFQMMTTPVSNGQFLDFVRKHPQWQRGKAPRVFAEARYLQHWAAPLDLGDAAKPEQPVVNVSWFAADAYCRAQGGRLPTWAEWEYVAAADEQHRDARKNPVWRERILRWYSKPSRGALPRVGLQAANAYGVRDIHGLVWEWTEDYSALLVDVDNRKQGDADSSRFCGAGALSMNDRDNYAVLMRVAMLSSLQGQDVTGNMGFRCAR